MSKESTSGPADTTHFGFKQVDKRDKASLVAEVFHSVAAKYDVMNDIMSLGIHRLWKRYTVDCSGVRSGHKILDLAGGTGDLAIQFARLTGAEGRVVVADINASMLQVGRDRLRDAGVTGNVEWVQADAEQLPFPDNHFDLVTIAFGLRNTTDKVQALQSMYQALKPGGRVLVLEFSKPCHDILSKAYDWYSFNLLPAMGKAIANDASSYRYLAESIRMHPDQNTLEEMMQQAGFEQTGFENLSGGIVALHKGFKF